LQRISEQDFSMLEAFAYGGWEAMRDSVSDLTDDDFSYAVAGLVKANYLEELGVFQALGRPAPLLTHGVGTRLTEIGKRIIGRWDDGPDATVSGMATSGTERVIGACVVCGVTEGVRSIFKSRSLLVMINDDGNAEARTLPPVDLCDSHRMPAALGEIVVGWCDDPNCRRWGVEGRKSPCGQRFLDIPSS
jgi:hypothetical protein